jgi:hypothetical protein
MWTQCGHNGHCHDDFGTLWIPIFLFVCQGLHHGDMSLLVSSLDNFLTLWNTHFFWVKKYLFGFVTYVTFFFFFFFFCHGKSVVVFWRSFYWFLHIQESYESQESSYHPSFLSSVLNWDLPHSKTFSWNICNKVLILNPFHTVLSFHLLPFHASELLINGCYWLEGGQIASHCLQVHMHL